MIYFDHILINRKPFLWFAFHILLGAVVILSKFIFILYFYYVILSSFKILLFNSNGIDNKFNFLMIYLVSFEVFGRILNCSPWIPYEISKYVLLLLLTYGLFKIKIKNYTGFFLLILLIPSLFFDLSGKVTLQNLIFNFLGPLSLCLSIWFFSNQKISSRGFSVLLRLLLLPLISILTICLLRTPDFNTAEFELGASKSFTGGFGSNQVSTIFGIGFFLIVISLFNEFKISGYWYFDVFILCLFLFLGLLSFSRGGIIGGFFALLIYILKMNSFANRKYIPIPISKIKIYVIPTILLLICVFIFSNALTDGKLLLRYKGQTSGSIIKDESITFDKLTTGRFELFKSEYELFQNNLFGVGAGASQFVRGFREEVVTHTELGRLMSEHGLLGVLFFALLLYFFLVKIFQNSNFEINAFLLSIFFIAIFTSFHAATRTYVTPLYMGLAFLKPVKIRSDI